MINIAINILDNEEYVLELIKDRFVTNPNFVLSVFTQPEPFIASISNDVDLVITDIRVARYDPIQTIKTICDNYPGIRVIAMSAYFDKDVLMKLINCRVDAVVEKSSDPVWFDELFHAVERFIPAIKKKKEALL